jgi:uncharacterized damage-inducible protein DinB
MHELKNMDYKEHIIAQTERATESIFRFAKAMPEDMLTWSVEDLAQTALGILRECARSPLAYIAFLEHRALYLQEFEKLKKSSESWSTIDEIEQEAFMNSDKLYAAIRNVPDNDLESTIQLAGTDGQEMKYIEIMGLQYWHLSYHHGQISFIQTCYGDTEGH